MKHAYLTKAISLALLLGNLEANEMNDLADQSEEIARVAKTTQEETAPFYRQCSGPPGGFGISTVHKEGTSASEESEDDKPKFVGEDTVLFYIINETDKIMPVSLGLDLWDENRRPSYDRLVMRYVNKEVAPRSASTFMESEAVLWKWFADAYKLKQPQNCSFTTMLHFNTPVKNRNSDYFGGGYSIGVGINFQHYVAGMTYKIVPSDKFDFEIECFMPKASAIETP